MALCIPPNDRAIEPQRHDIYARFGLNDRQIELLAPGTPKRHHYLQSARGNRLFVLSFGPVALALCGSSAQGAQARIDAGLAEHGRDGFVEAFLRNAGLDWAADLVDGFSAAHAGTMPTDRVEAATR